MKISTLMIPDPITIPKSTTIQEAIEVMKAYSIRHLPVVSEDNRLEGFVTLADLKQGLIPSMVGDFSLADLMIKDPITVHPEDEVETAARYIYNHKIGGIPVVREGFLVGIITESDILRAFIDIMGLMTASSRIEVAVGPEPGALGEALRVIGESGGDVISVGMPPNRTEGRVYFFRLSACSTAPIKEALEHKGFQVLAALD
ncbi:MAG: CBS and ACT domain-containing protein [Desulfobacteraceae bacterium]